ncbi:FkbM family methyltransferase [Breoghania sp. L-A4]|uniref:FkbM family methyltransferase n=1 Tax=Breoghania sp. L-A4 TaxID=2304600 RepID=UPI000E357F84|nr:FkbM family methyltransferase [Breoghania sp. L-A4]AXS39881.1 FkbM family methyltransferase [Breoghania sp. L-A4]
MIDDLIIDAGMHKGEDAEYYLKKGFRVVGIEANPELCAFAQDRLKGFLDSGQLTILNVAIVKDPGPTTFYVSSKSTVWGTTKKNWVERNERMGSKAHEIIVDGVPFSQILETYGVPYYLKIDIEGSDILCLEGLLGSPTTPKYISIESTKTSWKELKYEFDLFERLGYSHFKVVRQSDISDQRCPNPPREGKYVDHAFESESSGLFGEEAPGIWLSRRIALLVYFKIYIKYFLFGNYGVIPNLHKRIHNWPRLRRLVHPSWYDTHAKQSAHRAAISGYDRTQGEGAS